MRVKLKHQRVTIQLQKVIDDLATKSNQDLYQQKQSLEQQLEVLQADLKRTTPLEERRQEVETELAAIQSQLRKSHRKELLDQKRSLEMLLDQIDTALSATVWDNFCRNKIRMCHDNLLYRPQRTSCSCL
jgi:uncharacterized protein YpiB (UPF0302 family)